MKLTNWIHLSLAGAMLTTLAGTADARPFFQCPGMGGGSPPQSTVGGGSVTAGATRGTSTQGSGIEIDPSAPTQPAPSTPAPGSAGTRPPTTPGKTVGTPAPSAPKSKTGVPTQTAAPSGPTLAGGASGASTQKAPRTETQHGPSAQRELRLKWDHPVHAGVTTRSSETSVAIRSALPMDEALRAIAGEDPRPLLVLRECSSCAGNDRALLLPGIDNERTILLARWFHCVKIPMAVSEKDHAFHTLFSGSLSGHMFLSQADGTGRITLESDVSRPELWAAMGSTLGAAYGKDPTPTTREISKLLDRLDTLDARERELQKRRDDMLESSVKVDGSKIEQAGEDIADVKRDLERTRETIEKLSRLDVVRRPAAPAQR